MSRYRTYHIEKGYYISYQGEKTLVAGTCERAGDLVVHFIDRADPYVYNPEEMKPLSADNVPDWLQKGKAVEFNDPYNPDKEPVIRVVEDVWLRKGKSGLSQVFVNVVGYNPLPLKELMVNGVERDVFRPVSNVRQSLAQVVEECYSRSTARDPDYFMKWVRPNRVRTRSKKVKPGAFPYFQIT